MHRIGRTGRAGKKGIAVSFVTSREIDHLRIIENMTKKKMDKMPIPTMHDVMAGNQKQRLISYKKQLITMNIKNIKKSPRIY